MLTGDGRRPRGRPRAYDAGKALGKARDAFWKAGFSGTSLDDLGAATGMNRPSLYGAFGPKSQLYLTTLDRYRAESLAVMERLLDPQKPLREGLLAVFNAALAIYFPKKGAARGCFLIGTAATEAVGDAKVRNMLGGSLRDFDGAFEKRFRAARGSGEVSDNADAATLAKLTSAMLHSLALRSRAGDARKELEEFAVKAVEMICAAAKK